MSDLALKVARRVQADLNPSLGFPGGTCQVIERIRNEIRNPGLQEKLIEQVEHGKALGKPEANKVYDLEQERGAGIFKRLVITPHAQYRMDQRGVGVPQLRATFQLLSKLLNDWKSRKSPKYDDYALKMKRGEPIRWVDPRSKTTIVFAVRGDVATIITVYEEGHADPRPQAEESCRFEPYFQPQATALKVAARYREAALIQPPPRLVEAVSNQVAALVCGHYWAKLNAQVKVLLEVMKEPEERERLPDHRAIMVNLQQGIKLCQQYATKPRAYKGKGTLKVPLDLTGWKYLEGKEGIPRRKMIEKFYDPIKVQVNFKQQVNALGKWFSTKGLLMVNVPAEPAEAVIQDIISAQATVNLKKVLQKALHQIGLVLIHELRHSAQSFLDLLHGEGPGKAGRPSPKLRNDPEKDWDRDWELRDVEFQPMVGDLVLELTKRLKKTPPKYRKDVAKAFMGEKPPASLKDLPRYMSFPGNYLPRLKKEAPDKWREAVSEIYQGVRNLL